MSLEYKFSDRENLKDIQTFIVDDSQRSTKYFRVSDVPQVLQKGKNLLRITAHPTNLVDGTQIYVDVRDSNGQPIYFEIPDYLEADKSRVISIWIYNDKGIDNTPNGEATITLLGIANVDLNGNPLPPNQRGKINVKWQTTLNVDRDRNNSSEIIFNTDNVPNVVVSQSVELYENQAQTENTLTETIQTGKARYIFSGTSPIIQITDSSILNSEMINGDIILSEFTKPAVPITNIEGAQSSTFFSSSIGSILNDTTLKPLTNFTTSFDNREDLTHTYESISEANYKIQYIQSGSNVTTQNKRNFVNLEFNNIDPITGVVDKIKILAKSQGLSGDFEFLNEVQIPYSSSVDIKVPIPSKNLNDPKILKLLYLNAEGSISRTETISEPFVFDGEQVYIGGDDNLISGSIFISNTVGTGIEIGGASSGFMRSVGYRGITSASLGKAPGGFVIYSGSGNLVFGEDQLLGVGMQFVGDNDDRHLVFSTANGGILDVKTDKFFIGNLTEQYISGSDGNIEISSSIFHLDPKANGGDGSLIIGANATILSDLTVENIRTPAQIDGIASTEANASSSIKADGFARFVSASIGGWGITTSSIEGGNLIMKPEGILQTRDFASGLKGWKISSEGNGTAEFENVRIRGTLRTTTFEKESVNAVGGQLWVANSTTITGSVTDTETTMSVKNASGFSAGEILLIKKVDNTGFQTEYVLLNSASLDSDGSNEDETYGRIMVQRAYGSGTQGDFVGDLASSAQAYEDGQVIVSTGKLNTGYIKMNANPNDVNTPYMDIVERTGSGLYDVALKVRLGDLSGLANSDYVFGDSTPGFGLATDNVFLQGGIIAKTGSIGGIKMDDGKLFTGNGVYGNANTGFYVDSGSKFALGSKLLWNPSTETLTIRGSLQFADGTDVEGAVDAASNSSVARTVELSADKYVVTFDEFGNEAPSNQTITLTATPQNFTGDVYYEFYKDASIQGSRSTTNTFTVDTALEKPTSSTPKTYEVRAFTGSSGGTAASTDSLTLFGLQPGSDGAAGVDAVTAFLTNESHTLPLSSSGAIQSYAGADTQMKVFEGITDKTSNYSFTESSAAYITVTSSSNAFTITNTTSPYSGSVTITAVSESVSLSKIMSIGITRQGDDGQDGTPGVSGDNAKTLIGSVDSQIFAFDDSTDNSATPGTINFSFSQQNLNDVIVSSDITITTADSNNVTNFSFNNNSVGGPTNQKSGIVSGSVSYTGGFSSGGLNGAKTSLPLTISCTNDTLTDSVTIFKVEGGSDGVGGVDAVTTFLTNESHTLPSQNDGTVVSFVGAVTDMEVFEGTTNKNSEYTFSKDSTTSVSSSISGNTVTITSMAHDSGSVIITAVSESVSLSKTMTLSKSKQGTAGLPGAAAKLLSLSSDSQVFSFPSASSNTPIDNDVLIIVNQQNLSGTIDAGDITIKDSGGNTLADPAFVASVTDGTGQVSGSITFNTTLSSTKSKLPITIEVSKDGLEDSLKIFKIDGGGDGVDGTDAVIAFLTNESHTFAADSSGSIAVFAGGSTDMEVFEGITNVTSNYVISSSNGAGVSASDSGNTVTISTMTADSAYVNINASSGSVSIDKIMSLVKSKQGPDGSDGTSAKLLIGSLDSQVMAFDDVIDTSATPSSIEFSFQQQNLVAPISASDVTIQMNGGGNITNFTFDNTDAVSGTGIVSGSVSFAGNTNAGGMGSDKSKFPLTISATKDSLQDAVKIFKVEGGSDGTSGVSAITALLTNDSHTLPVSSSGDVISFAGASTDILVFQGTSNVTNDYTINTGSISSHITTTTSGDTVTITNSTTPFSGSVEITATSGSVVLTKLMSISQALQGDDGSDGAPGTSASLISLTGDSQVFAFASASATTPDDTTIELFITQQNLGKTLTASDITIIDAVGGSHNVPTFAPTSLPNNSGVISGSLVFNTNSPSPKAKYPITITVTSGSLSDSFKIFALDGGADGTSGTDAITVIVGNESHTLAAGADGLVPSYVGAETDVTIFEGVTDKTTNYFINGVSNTGITVDNDFNSFNSSSLNVTNMNHDSGSVIITAISGGIHHSGWGSRTGEDWATSQFLVGGAGDINGTDNDWHLVDNPDTISIGSGDGELRNNYVEFGNNADNDRVWIAGKDIFAYDDTKTYYIEARFKRVSGTGTVYVGVNGWSNESTKRNVVGSNTFSSQHYIAAAGFSFGENEGTDWVTKRGYFSGHGASSATNSGESPDINNPKTIHTNATYISPMFIASHPTNNGVVRLDYIEIKEVKDGSGNLSTGVVKIDKTMSLVKSRAGTDGAPGAAGSGSKTVSLTAATNVVTYDADGLNPSPSGTITLSANSQNFTDGYFKFTGDGITDELTYTNGVSANGDTKNFTIPSSYFSTPKTITVSVSEAADSTTELTFDTVTIVAVQPGAAGAGGVDAVTAFLTSEADVVPAANDGTVSSFNGSGTEMFIYEGVTNVSSNYTVTNQNSTDLTATISNRVLTISALTPDSGSVILTAVSGGVSISKTYSIAKSKAGPQGDQGANNQDFSFLDASLSGVQGTLAAGLLMNSDVFGYHGAIGSGTTATLADFTSFLDSGGNFYLGGNASGASNPSDGYLAWNNTNKSLLISGSNANIEVDKFLLGSGTSQYISGSNGNVEIAGDVTFRGRPDNGDGNVVFFDDFSQYSAVGDTNGGNAPKMDGTGDAWFWNKGASSSTPSLEADTDCISGKALVVGNNSGDDEANIISNTLIPFNESSLYEVEVRIKRTAGTSNTRAYVGINGMQSDGVTRVGYDGNNNTSGHYITLSSNNLGTGNGTGYFQTFKGYFKGATRTGGSNGDTTMHDDKTNPGTLRAEINNGFISAYLLLNYNDTQGITHVDYIKIKEFSSGGTSRISGDSITTGTIKSNNLSTDTGTALYLNDGVMKIGGTGAYTTEKGILLDGPNAKFAVGELGGNYMRFNHTAGKLEISTPNFEIDSGGAVQVTGAISVLDADGNAITLGDPAEAVENLFNEITNPSAGISALDGRPADFFSTYGNNVASNIKFSDFGGTIGKVVELSNPGDTTIGMATKIIKKEASAYRITITVKGGATNYTSGTTGMYLRVYESNDASAREDGVKFITHASYANSSNSEPGSLSTSGEATLSWTKISGSAGVGNVSNNLNGSYWPQEWITYQTNYTPSAGTEFFSMNILNWSGNGLNSAYVRDLVIKPKTNLGTQIGGRQIKTGELQSLNLSPNEGSVISLDSGSMKLGGFVSPGFEVTKEGFVTATNIVEKFVNVNSANSGSYYQTVSGHTTLVLDGSLGGSVTMNLTLQVAPPYVINDILFPTNAGSDDIARLELSIQDDGIQFDDGAITSGYSSFGLLLQTYTLTTRSGQGLVQNW